MRLPGNFTGALSYPKSIGLACGNDFKTSYKMMEVDLLSCGHMRLSGNVTGALSYPKSIGLACKNDLKTSYKMMEVDLLSCSHYADFR